MAVLELKEALAASEAAAAHASSAKATAEAALAAKAEEVAGLRRSLGLATAERSRLETELEAVSAAPGADAANLLAQLDSERATVPFTCQQL